MIAEPIEQKGTIPGSMEAFQEELREELTETGLFPAGFEIVATMPDSVVVCVYGPSGKHHYQVAYTAGEGDIELGAVQSVELAMVVTAGEEGAEAPPAQGMQQSDYDEYEEGDDMGAEEDDDEYEYESLDDIDEKHPGHNQQSHAGGRGGGRVGGAVRRAGRAAGRGARSHGRGLAGAAAGGAIIGSLAGPGGAAAMAAAGAANYAIGSAVRSAVRRRRGKKGGAWEYETGPGVWEAMDAEFDAEWESVRGKALGHDEYVEIKSFDVKASGSVTEINGVKGWTFDGYASVWDVRDHEGDTVRRGAFKRTLSEGLPLVKYEHGNTIGRVLEAVEDEKGLLVRGFVPIDDHTEFMRKLMKIGAVSKMSYGWKPYPDGAKSDGQGGRELTDIKLYEVSPVAVPMLDATEITNVKSLPNGLPDAPFDVQMGAAGSALLAAKSEAEALMRRRERVRDGQLEYAVSEKNLAAISGLGAAAGETLLACLQAEAKAGRAVSGTRKRHLAALVQSVQAFIASLPENERVEMTGLLEPEDEAGDGDSKKAATAKGGIKGREAVVRDLVADYLEAQLSRHAGRKTEG